MTDETLVESVADDAAPVEAPVADAPQNEPVAAPKDEAPRFKTVKEAVDAAAERARDPQGRFVRQEGQSQPLAPKAAVAPPQGQQTAIAPQAPLRPPVGWSPAAKAAFGALPPDVQSAVAKREAEVNEGFRVLQNYRGMEEFQPYVDRAGTTFAECFKKMIAWETALVQDPINLVRHVAALTRINPQLLAQALTDPTWAARFQQQQQQLRPQQQQVNFDQLIERKFAEREINSEVSKFLADPAHEHAEAVADHMAQLIQSGQDLENAYQNAIWANPEIRKALINKQAAELNAPAKQQAAVHQAKAAAKAITGAPTGGVPPGGNARPKSIRAAIDAAVEMHSGR